MKKFLLELGRGFMFVPIGKFRGVTYDSFDMAIKMCYYLDVSKE